MRQARLAGFLGFSALALLGDVGEAAALQGAAGRLEASGPRAIETVTYDRRHGGHGHFRHHGHGRHHYGLFGPWGYPRYAYYPRTPYYYPAPYYYYPPYYDPAPMYYPAPIYAYPVP